MHLCRGVGGDGPGGPELPPRNSADYDPHTTASQQSKKCAYYVINEWSLTYICFRDIMLATSQEQIEMRMTLANAETRTVQMNNQLKKIDDIVDKTEKLLYQMIPQNVAERLRKGANPMDTVEVFESVTMLFSGMFN